MVSSAHSPAASVGEFPSAIAAAKRAAGRMYLNCASMVPSRQARLGLQQIAEDEAAHAEALERAIGDPVAPSALAPAHPGRMRCG